MVVSIGISDTKTRSGNSWTSISYRCNNEILVTKLNGKSSNKLQSNVCHFNHEPEVHLESIDHQDCRQYKQDIPALRVHRASSWCRCHISKLFIDGKRHKVTPDYAMTGWRNGIQFHLRGTKTRLNVLEARMCANLGSSVYTREKYNYDLTNQSLPSVQEKMSKYDS
jgi:hypothetical protein